MPRVTVVIPTYNTAAFIQEAVDSVLAQTYADLSLVVVDDGSTDGTREILASYAKRLTYVYKTNGGFASALNEGIRRAASEFVAWLSADDVFLPDKIGRQVAQLDARRDIAISHTAFYEIDATGKILRAVRVAPALAENVTVFHLLQRCYVNGSTCLFRRTCFDEAGLFDETLGLASDWEMWMRLARHFRFGYVNEPLVSYRQHEANRSEQRREQVLASSYAVADKILREVPMEEIFGLPKAGSRATRKEAARILYEASLKLRNLPPTRRKVLAKSVALWPWQPALVRLPLVMLRAATSVVLRKLQLFAAADRCRKWCRASVRQRDGRLSPPAP